MKKKRRTNLLVLIIKIKLWRGEGEEGKGGEKEGGRGGTVSQLKGGEGRCRRVQEKKVGSAAKRKIKR